MYSAKWRLTHVKQEAFWERIPPACLFRWTWNNLNKAAQIWKKNITVTRGCPGTPNKCPQLFLISCPTLLIVFPVMFLTAQYSTPKPFPQKWIYNVSNITFTIVGNIGSTCAIFERTVCSYFCVFWSIWRWGFASHHSMHYFDNIIKIKSQEWPTPSWWIF